MEAVTVLVVLGVSVVAEEIWLSVAAGKVVGRAGEVGTVRAPFRDEFGRESPTLSDNDDFERGELLMRLEGDGISPPRPSKATRKLFSPFQLVDKKGQICP